MSTLLRPPLEFALALQCKVERRMVVGHAIVDPSACREQDRDRFRVVFLRCDMERTTTVRERDVNREPISLSARIASRLIPSLDSNPVPWLYDMSAPCISPRPSRISSATGCLFVRR